MSATKPASRQLITRDVLRYIKARNNVNDVPTTEQVIGHFESTPREVIESVLAGCLWMRLVREIKPRRFLGPSRWEAI